MRVTRLLPDHLPGRLFRWGLSSTIIVGVALALVGRTDLPLVNAYLGVCVVAGLIAMLTIHADLLRERFRAGQTGADPGRLAALRVLSLVVVVVGLLDAGRLHLSPPMPPALQMAGLSVFAIALGLVVWAVSVNAFFLPVVRIQTERGHRVVTNGPYRMVRHPGYAGMAAAMPASALALGSWWALMPALALAFLFVRRAAHEDRFLREHLNGYASYAEQVRARLLPGAW